jgi:hypothetical protein
METPQPGSNASQQSDTAVHEDAETTADSSDDDGRPRSRRFVAPWRDDLPAEPDGWKPFTGRERLMYGLPGLAVIGGSVYEAATSSDRSQPIGYLVIGAVVVGTGVVRRRRR